MIIINSVVLKFAIILFQMYNSSVKITKYEKAKIIGQRATQIAYGAHLTIDVPKHIRNPNKIAEMEFEKGTIPYIIRRKMPDGSFVDVKLSSFKDKVGVFDGNVGPSTKSSTGCDSDTDTVRDIGGDELLDMLLSEKNSDLVNETMSTKVV